MKCSVLGVQMIDRIRYTMLLLKTRIADFAKKTARLKWNSAGHVCRKGGLTQPIGGCRRTASDDEAHQERDGGMTWTHLQGTELILRLT